MPQSVGVLAVQHVETRRYADIEIEALQTITSQLATVLGRQRTEADLRKSEVRLAEALSTARLGSFEWDPATGVVTPGISLSARWMPDGQFVLDQSQPYDRD